jgi:hypothetical protein
MGKSSPFPKRTKKSKSKALKKPNDTPPKTMLEAMNKALDKVEDIAGREYDGVLGRLPEWVPEPERTRFLTTRRALLEEYPVKNIHRFMIAQEKRWDGGFSFGPNMPSEIEERVDTLNDIKKLVSLGEQKGLKAILGEERFNHQIRGEKVLNAAKKAHVQTHGSSAEQKNKWKKMQVSLNKLHRQNFGKTYDWLCKTVSEKFNCSQRTIERRTTNPTKK